MAKHGGKREGAGRPVSKNRKVYLSVSLETRTIKILNRMGTSSKSAAIDTLATAYETQQVINGNWKIAKI